MRVESLRFIRKLRSGFECVYGQIRSSCSCLPLMNSSTGRFVTFWLGKYRTLSLVLLSGDPAWDCLQHAILKDRVKGKYRVFH